ncbi:MAG: hypothetical protein ACJ739_16345 [Acidimicrobiales bacterium]
MGLFTTRGEDDEEDGDVQLSGLEHLDGAGDDGDDEVTFELDEWSEPDRRLLAERLVALGAPHEWEGTTLVIAAADEAWVERIMDQVDEELSAGPTAGDGTEEQVAYDLSEWDDESCVTLLDALSADTIPYALDGDELFVAAVDEARVDEIVGALTTPGATLTVGGPASFEAMNELFIAADELSNDPDDKGATRAIVEGARAAALASAPFGTDAGWWDGVVARAGALAELVESTHPDPEHIVEVATAVRAELRPYI